MGGEERATLRRNASPVRAEPATRFFRWQDASEAVDESMQPRNRVEIARNILVEYGATTKQRLEEEKAGLGDRDVTGGLLTFCRT